MSREEIELGQKDIVFLVMGATGAGKSTFINAALNKKVAVVGRSLTSCTIQPLPISVDPIPDCPGLKGYRLVLLDTPGFNSTYKMDAEMLALVAKWLEAPNRNGALIGGVLYLHDIYASRFADEVHQNLLQVFRLCDVPNTVFVTTKWPSNRDDVLEKRDEELRSKYLKTFIGKGLNVCQFQGNRSSAWDIINLLLRSINTYVPGPKDIIFPVIGPTGAGKSTFINVALGQNVAEVGHTTTSCTKHPFPIFIDPIPNFPRLRGYRLVLLDTPGFDDSHEEDVEILKRIAKWLEISRRKGAIVGGVLYFHDISAKRFTGTARQSLLMFSRLCGDDTMPKTVLVTTNWPSYGSEVLDRREEEMKGEHWKTLIEHGLNIRRFYRTRDSAWKIIDHLLQDVPNILRGGKDVSDVQVQTEFIEDKVALQETLERQELSYTLLKMQQEALALKESFTRTGNHEAKKRRYRLGKKPGKGR